MSAECGVADDAECIKHQGTDKAVIEKKYTCDTDNAASTPAGEDEKTSLNTAISMIENTLNGLKKADYTEESWEELQGCIEAAKDMLADLEEMLANPDGDTKVTKKQVGTAIENMQNPLRFLQKLQ